MARSETNPQAEAFPKTLPLFRPEVLAAQERMHGDVLRIRAFSPLFFVGLGAITGAVVLVYLAAGHYTEKAHIPGSLFCDERAASAMAPAPWPASSVSTAGRPLATFDVPARWMGSTQPGGSITVRCPGSSGPGRRMTGTVLQISPSASAVDPSQTTYRVAVALPPETAQLLSQTKSTQSEAKLEAEIPLGRKPLIHWLFDRTAP